MGKRGPITLSVFVAGLGFGIKKFRVVFVFENEKVLNSFINSGWEFGGQTTAAAQVGGDKAR